MIVDKDGRVAGSVDLAQLAALYAQATDDELRAHYRQVAAENGTVFPEPEPEPEPAAQSALPEPVVEVEEVDYEDMSLAALQSLAEARGLPKYGTKAEIAERLYDNDADGEVSVDPEEE